MKTPEKTGSVAFCALQDKGQQKDWKDKEYPEPV